MWKDFFYYSKSERRAVYVLLVLIAFLVIAIIWLPPSRSAEEVALYPVDSLRLKKKEEHYVDKSSSDDKTVGHGWKKKPELFFFDPNLADSVELRTLGLPAYVVRNIIKYRQKGGVFRTPESMSRIYGLNASKFEELKPFIRISDSFRKKVGNSSKTHVEHKVMVQKSFKYPEGTLIDVNQADTSELKKIPGIGSVIARKIVAYRNKLGGFYSLSQLSEIDYVTPEITRWFRLGDSISVERLKINELSIEKLRSHPYINFYQAKIIWEHRKKRGDIKSLSQLSLYEEFAEKDLERLSVYISFD